MTKSSVNGPTLTALDSLKLHWQMTRAEKFAFEALVRDVRPEIAIEIGTYHGGSLQILTQYSEHVHSLDISPEPRDSLMAKFPNVDFHVGSSVDLIHPVVEGVEAAGKKVEFVLIDGDHSEAGVTADINALLRLRPKSSMTIVFHDSFHPPCRAGILNANWLSCPYVHFVEVDFVPGVFHHKQFDTAPAGSMYGGLAVARLKPEPREGDLQINCSQQGLFDTVLASSCYSTGPIMEVQLSNAKPVGIARRLRNRIGMLAKIGG